MGDERNVYKVLVGKAGRKATIIILWHRWKDKIKMDLRETGWGEWIQLALDRTGRILCT
jgi:hypothetical protein